MMTPLAASEKPMLKAAFSFKGHTSAAHYVDSMWSLSRSTRKCRNLPIPRTSTRHYSRSSTRMSAGTSPLLYAGAVSATAVSSAVPEDAKNKKHHLKGQKGFDNPWPSWKTMPGPAIGLEMAKRRINGTGNSPDTTPPTVNVQKPKFLPTRDTPQLRATWLGHACYLVEFPSGLRVLFDPVFSERCSPFQFLGPKRYTPTPCDIEEIPIIDAVCISHNHYDHLDHPTIQKIFRKHPNVHFFAPLANKQWFIDSKIPAEQVTDLDWWEECDFTLTPQTGEKQVSTAGTTASTASNSTITARLGALPCQHMGNRGVFDRGHTLWSSWSVHSGGSSLYFAGDTGYRSVPKGLEMKDDHTPEVQAKHPHCPAFAEIGKFRGPFDLGLIPIGAYEPRFVMSPMHADPYDAVDIFREVRCRRALAMHWGTWVLTEEDVMEPPRILKDALSSRHISETGVFDVVELGESREFQSHGADDKSVDWETQAAAKL